VNAPEPNSLVLFQKAHFGFLRSADFDAAYVTDISSKPEAKRETVCAHHEERQQVQFPPSKSFTI
jgi:hypothetical protein